MKKTFITSFCLLFSTIAYCQNAPWSLWGGGLDGSVYQQAVFYCDTQNGLLFEAPIYPNGAKAPIELNWRGGGVSPFKIAPNGYIGLGISTPEYPLHINGSNPVIALTSTGSAKWSAFRGNAATWLFGYNGESGAEDISLGTQDGTGTRTLTFAAGGSARMKVSSNGNIGIGTLTPSEMLSVNGKIRAKEIKVETINWPDYVFHSSYQLPDLKATEQFINKNQHLPEMPSAAEVEKDGINLGEMNAKLLKKIEELTLHLIEQNKLNHEQNERIRQLEKQVNKR